MAEPTYLTQEGYDKIAKELEELKTVRRPALAQKLKEAVAEGDLRENADYHDAKEQQGFLEGRIQQLEHLIRTAQIISSDDAANSQEVRVGSVVTIIEEGGSGEEETYTIVGAAEANPRMGKISQQSPIGAALLGRRKNEKVRVQTPDGITVFKIKKIK
jgi:transcription elongation factor GreA